MKKQLTACQRNLAFQFFIYMMQATYGSAANWPNPEPHEKAEILSGKLYA